MKKFNEIFNHLEDVLYPNDDEVWNSNFEIFKEYIEKFKIFPP